MSTVPRTGARPAIRSAIAALAAGAMLLAMGLPAAASGPARLKDPQVEPRSGTTATTFTFSVTFRDPRGSAPESVAVVVGRRTYAVVAHDGDDWKGGVRFTLRVRLPAGRHEVRFVALDRNGEPTEQAGPSLRVNVPAPPPDPDEGGGTGPRPGGGDPGDADSPDGAEPGAPGDPEDPEDPNGDGASPDGSAAVPGWFGTLPPGGPAAEHRRPSTSPSGPDRLGEPPDVANPGQSAAGMPGTWQDLTSYLQALGIDRGRSPLFQIIPVLVWSTGGVALALAFGIFGKRRRDGEPPAPDEVLEANAARGVDEPATAALVPDERASPPPDPELSLPRWRRPSLLEARKTDPTRDGVIIPKLRFAQGAAVAPVPGFERRLIRYLVVQLLDTPDEFRGSAIGSLAQGDEVQLLERSGTYWLVLCPDGREGWIHRMTLGDVVGAQPAPSARQAWAPATAEAEVDEDVLLAFMTARGRA